MNTGGLIGIGVVLAFLGFLAGYTYLLARWPLQSLATMAATILAFLLYAAYQLGSDLWRD